MWRRGFKWEGVVQEYTNRINELSYTAKDFSSIKSLIIEKIPELTDEWTDFNESDIGIVFIEALSALSDQMHLYLDKQALECYMHSVNSAVKMLELFYLHLVIK